MCRTVELQLSAGPEPQHSTDGEGRTALHKTRRLAEAEISKPL